MTSQTPDWADEPLLERHEFREQGKAGRDTCIVPWCNAAIDDIHHIIERDCWPDGGYYLSNAAPVCNPHHQAAEENLIPPQAFWRWKDVAPFTPPGMPADVDKWGGEFDTPRWEDLKDRIKYPSTGHFPFSPEHEGRRNDHTEITQFANVPLVLTIKMDGSNAMVTHDRVTARNGTDAPHASFDYLKQLHSKFKHRIPEHLQIFGEWLYAKHSISYTDDLALDSYFQVFGVFDQRYNLWLSWPEVEQWADEIGHPTVPMIETGEYEEWQIYTENKRPDFSTLGQSIVNRGHEGLVARVKYPYHYGQFEQRLAKYVRDGHVQTDTHWKHQEITQNELAEDSNYEA